MTRILTVMVVAVAVAVAAAGQRRGSRGVAPESEQYPPVPKTEAEKRILATINDAAKANELYLNVPAADGRMLRLLTEAVDAKNVVEIGTSTGISGLWLCMALEKTGGKLTTFEFDPGRAETARTHFKKAGVDEIVKIVQGDAHKNVGSLRGPVDVAFIDADKEGYIDYLQKLLPLIRPGGLILAHNVDMVPEYVKAVTTNSDLETVFYMQGAGLAITLKKR